MAFALNPVAVTAAPLLRALKAAEWTSKKDLAERAGRHPNHIQRDLKVLAENGLVADVEPFAVTAEGEAQLAALDRAGDPNAAGAPTALHADLEPHPLNPRKDFETPDAEEKLDELRVSIVKSGLLQPIVVRPRPELGKWWIIAGERRWRAIGQAISDGDWEDDQPVAITIREVDDRDHLLLALNENLQRSNMSAIEEGVAFAAAVHDFGLPTEELASRTGKSQRYVQQRIALLKLSQEDQDRMRLPKAHPSYLSFKDARSQTQTARQPAPEVIEEPAADVPRLLTVADFGVPSDWRADDVASAASWIAPFTMERFEYRDKKWALTIQVAQLVGGVGWVHGTSSEGPTSGSYSTLNGVWSGNTPAYATREKAIACAAAYIAAGVLGKAPEKAMAWLANPTAREPGSSAETPAGAEAPSLGKSLSDIEALILAEVTDAVERRAHPIHPSYAFCLSPENQAGVASLVARNLLAVKKIGDSVLIRTALHAGGVKNWLDGLGFYADREALLFELAVRVQGADNVFNRQQCGVRYATAWLNLTGDPRNDAVEASPSRDFSQDAADALAYRMTALETEQPSLIEETEEEKAARRRAERMAAEAAFDDRAVAAFAEAMRQKMARKRAQGATGWSGASVIELADGLVGHVAKGDPVDIALFAMMVDHRAQAVGYQRIPDLLRRMPTPRMEQLMIAARANGGPSPDGPEEADPEGDFIEAELDDAEAAIDLDEATTPRTSAEPAVPIRKSITADHIVCLEDGRKFKSLKRHLRTKYNLSPEEYRAKWGLPADYPMVAPNYAKARADLARQMGISV